MSMSIIVNNHATTLGALDPTISAAQSQRIRTIVAAQNRLSAQSPLAATAVVKYNAELAVILNAILAAQ